MPYTKPTLMQFDQMQWPNWPYLPIKNYKTKDTNGLCRLAVIMISSRGVEIAIDTNVWAVVAGKVDRSAWESTTLSALENAGWEVD